MLFGTNKFSKETRVYFERYEVVLERYSIAAK